MCTNSQPQTDVAGGQVLSVWHTSNQSLSLERDPAWHANKRALSAMVMTTLKDVESYPKHVFCPHLAAAYTSKSDAESKVHLVVP